MWTTSCLQAARNNLKEAVSKPTYNIEESLMFLAKKIMAANVLVGGIVLATVGTAALTYVLFDPDAREKMKDCADKFRACRSKKRSDDTELGDTETA